MSEILKSEGVRLGNLTPEQEQQSILEALYEARQCVLTPEADKGRVCAVLVMLVYEIPKEQHDEDGDSVASYIARGSPSELIDALANSLQGFVGELRRAGDAPSMQ